MPATISTAKQAAPRQSVLILIDARLSSRSSRHTERRVHSLVLGRALLRLKHEGDDPMPLAKAYGYTSTQASVLMRTTRGGEDERRRYLLPGMDAHEIGATGGAIPPLDGPAIAPAKIDFRLVTLHDTGLISPRTYNCLVCAADLFGSPEDGAPSYDQLRLSHIAGADAQELIRQPYFGKHSFAELREVMARFGWRLDPPPGMIRVVAAERAGAASKVDQRWRDKGLEPLLRLARDRRLDLEMLLDPDAAIARDVRQQTREA